jgi:hypothetical protein
MNIMLETLPLQEISRGHKSYIITPLTGVLVEIHAHIDTPYEAQYGRVAELWLRNSG